MMGRRRGSIALAAAALLAAGLAGSPPASAAVRLTGSAGALAYGYQDAGGGDHLWLYPTLRLSAYHLGGGWSLHVSGAYLGDNADNFSRSGQGRLYKGVLRYGDLGSPLTLRAGRFFRYRGVTLGVIDGLEAAWRLNGRWKVTGFAGLLGPLNRRFELEDPGEAFSYGGEVQWSPVAFPFLHRSRFALSYVRQERGEGATRHLVGLNSYHRVGAAWTWFNALHLRPTEAPLRKFLSRLRYRTEAWSGTAEFGILAPNSADFSWFSDFNIATSTRVRFALERYVVPKRWAVGVEGAILTAEGKSGYRVGPALTLPWGQAGYRFSGGDQAVSSGPWANLRLRPLRGVELYAFGAMVSYEWDAMDLESEDLVMLHAGARYRPAGVSPLELHGEFQVYRTPQLDQDRRALGGLTWRFDTGRARR